MSTHPPGRRDGRKPRDNRPKNRPSTKPAQKPKRPVLPQEAIEHAHRVADTAPPFSPEVRAQLAVILAPMAKHLAAQQRPARVRAA
jgi:hypothetical protein